MTINATDIKLLESEVMADTTDGGGRRTSRIIPDGVAGNIFPKVSRLDSVYGRVNLRKIYGGPMTANKDVYAGAHAVITDAPDNAKIITTLFSTASETDTRTAARDRIESYVTSGPVSRMTLIGRQLPGQQTISAYQRVEEPIPELGEVLCLSDEPGGIVGNQQYVRIQSVTHEVRTYEDEVGEFKRRAITIDIGVSLRYEFNGPEAVSRFSKVTSNSKIRSTTVVDAARYFGIQPFALAASANDLTVKVASIYTQIVPTTTRETPISNGAMGGALNLLPAASVSTAETLPTFATGQIRFTRRAIKPGSLTISGSGIISVTDNGSGTISNASFSATVDYESGTITRTGGTASSIVTATATYTPAVSVSQQAHTLDVPVTLANRGTVYPLTLNPLPSAGSVIVDYRALGKWYRLRDNGVGQLAGDDAAYGAGTIDYATGSIVVTLGALPDVDSSVLVSFGSPAHYAIRSGASSNASAKVRQSFTLAELPINPDSFSLTYTSGGVNYTATDTSSGTISGDGVTGTINYTSGLVELTFTTRMPDSGTVVACQYEKLVPSNPALPTLKSLTTASSTSIDLASSVEPGTLVGSVVFAGSVGGNFNFSGPVTIKDNGVGLIFAPGNQIFKITGTMKQGTAAIPPGDQIIGTINYSTGEIAITTDISVESKWYTQTALGGHQSWNGYSYPASVSTGPANFGWRTGASGTGEAKTFDVTFTASPLSFDLTTTVADSIVPGSLLFSVAGKTYIDRNGVLYSDMSPQTGAATTAGSINYETGVASLSHWQDGSATAPTVISALSQYGNHNTHEVQFRTPGSPLRLGSFYFQVSTSTGELLSATVDEFGNLTATKITGTVNQETGVVRIKFGQMVTAAGNEGEPWFDPDAVVGGQIFKPTYIMPATLSYNCVVLANLPLNADILGLDPVRLPMDGRVPIFRPADVVVIHNTKAFTLPDPVTPGNTYSVGRANLADLWLEDSNGVRIATTKYLANLPAGSVTIAADFTAGTLVEPLIAKHRIEDMAVATDVQINGQVTIFPALSRDYDTDTFVSSAILFGDMSARVTNVFDLLAFSTWSDAPGPQASAQYNNIDYPIEVLNNGAVTERWRINFTTTTGFQVIGENLGVIATGNTAVDCAPANQLTGQPYFVIRATGWGAGWSAGNNLRFNTLSATAPIWCARTVLPGASLSGDSFSLQLRGDVDA